MKNRKHYKRIKFCKIYFSRYIITFTNDNNIAMIFNIKIAQIYLPNLHLFASMPKESSFWSSWHWPQWKHQEVGCCIHKSTPAHVMSLRGVINIHKFKNEKIPVLIILTADENIKLWACCIHKSTHPDLTRSHFWHKLSTSASLPSLIFLSIFLFPCCQHFCFHIELELEF